MRSLWFDYNDDWRQAHELIQDLNDQNASWIHAYLHRKEGDDWNARYWYRIAQRPYPSMSLKREWKEMWSQMNRPG